MTKPGSQRVKRQGFRHRQPEGIPALSLTQPWAELILHAGKDVENRTWATRYRGPLWLHAAKVMPSKTYDFARELAAWICPNYSLPAFDSLQRSAFVGLTWVVGCVETFDPAATFEDMVPPNSRWAFIGQFAWALDLDRTWALEKPLHALGALGLWRPTASETATLLERLPASAREALDQTGPTSGTEERKNQK